MSKWWWELSLTLKTGNHTELCSCPGRLNHGAFYQSTYGKLSPESEMCPLIPTSCRQFSKNLWLCQSSASRDFYHRQRDPAPKQNTESAGKIFTFQQVLHQDLAQLHILGVTFTFPGQDYARRIKLWLCLFGKRLCPWLDVTISFPFN